MNISRCIGCLGLATMTAAAFGQSFSPQILEVQKDPPVEIQRSIPLGPKPESDLLHLAVSLPFRDPEGAQQFADAVSDPKNPLYRHFISPEEVGTRFGLSPLRVQRVRAYLESQGMSVTLVGKNRLSILVDATVGQAESAFHTSIQEFLSPTTEDIPGATRFSFTTPPALPSDIAGDVIDICGMESFTRPKSHTALTATQLRSLYSVASLYSAGGSEGAGRTIAISSFDGYRTSNVTLECSLQSLPTPSAGAGSNIKIEAISGGTGSTGTASGEGDLDIQAVLCMAPLCNVIIYDNYQSSTLTGNNPIAVYTQEVNDNTADIITESYGWSLGTASNLSAHNLHLSMTSQGITYMAAAGDHGTTWVVNGTNFNYPAIEPEVLLVGGTSVTLNSNGTRSAEVGWNSSGDYGGGGWNVTTDTFNTRPTYQSTTTFLAGAGVPSLTSVPYRLVPDVSFDADPNTGYLIYISGSEAQAGGTSASSPACAGMMAELEEQLISDGALTANSAGKYRLGRMQDLLYSYNGASSVFYDVTSGTNGTLPSGAVSNAGAGWDTDTGWGPIIFSGLLAKIEQGISSVSVSPTSVAGGLTSTGTVTLQMAAPSGGAVVTLSSSNTSAATVPASVTVAAGATSATFTVTTLAVTSTQSVTVTATYNKIVRTAALSVTPLTVSSVTLSPTSVIGGVSSTGTVTISSAAPTAGTVVTLKSSSTSATVPASVTVASGKTTATFTVTTSAVASSTSATVTGTIGSSSANAALTITAPTVSSVTLSPTSLVGGASSTGTITLSGAAPTGGTTVSLKSSSTSSTVPSSVSVSAGAKTATFTITTVAVSASTSATITATLGSSSATANLTVSPASISGVTLSSASVVGGSTATITGTVTLSSAAGASGDVVTLTSSSTTAATVPTSVTVAAGATTATFTITHKVITASTATTITATFNSASKTASLTVSPFAVSSITLSPSSVVGGASSTATVTLNAVPSTTTGAVKVTLKSSSTSATAPASVSVAAGASSATATITTKAVTTATTSTITATVNSSSPTATLTIAV